MLIWSYQDYSVDVLNDCKRIEAFEGGLITGWWRTRDAAFFTMLGDVVEQIQYAIEEDPEEKEVYEQELAEILDPANWKEDPDGTVRWTEPGERYQDRQLYLVLGMVNDA